MASSREARLARMRLLVPEQTPSAARDVETGASIATPSSRPTGCST
jgi:hypothetical protein